MATVPERPNWTPQDCPKWIQCQRAFRKCSCPSTVDLARRHRFSQGLLQGLCVERIKLAGDTRPAEEEELHRAFSLASCVGTPRKKARCKLPVRENLSHESAHPRPLSCDAGRASLSSLGWGLSTKRTPHGRMHTQTGLFAARRVHVTLTCPTLADQRIQVTYFT